MSSTPARAPGRPNIAFDQSVQPLGVAEVELRRGILVSLARPPEQVMVARLARRRPRNLLGCLPGLYHGVAPWDITTYPVSFATTSVLRP